VTEPTAGSPRTSPTAAPSDDRSVLSRASTVLRAFRDDATVLPLAEISRRTGIPKSSLHRLLGQLVDCGMLERGPNGSYHLGLELFELARLVPVQLRLREVALPFMGDLYEATHETIHLGVLAGLDVLYIDRISGHRQAAVPTRVGGRMPIHCTGLGKAMLAHAGPELVQAVLEQGLPALTPRTIRHATVLEEALVDVRRDGVAYDREESTLGVVCVAAPILHQGQAVAALSITGPRGRFDPSRFAGAVSVASIGVARALERSTSWRRNTV